MNQSTDRPDLPLGGREAFPPMEREPHLYNGHEYMMPNQTGGPDYCRRCARPAGSWPDTCPGRPVSLPGGTGGSYIIADLDGEFIAGAGGSAGLVTLTPEELDRGVVSYGPAGGGGSERPRWRRQLRRAVRQIRKHIA